MIVFEPQPLPVLEFSAISQSNLYYGSSSLSSYHYQLKDSQLIQEEISMRDVKETMKVDQLLNTGLKESSEY